MITLHQALQDYVSMRQGLGYKFVQQAQHLEQFVVFMRERGAVIITTKLAVEWATLSPGRHASWAIRLTDVRGFAQHLRNLEPRTEIPPTGLLPYQGRTQPYLDTDTEIQALLTAAMALPPEHGLRRWTYHCLFGLLSVTGLRISEALALQRDAVDLTTGMLEIRGTKFGKSRLVPLHPSAQQVLADYALRRDDHFGVPRSAYFLVAERGGRLFPQNVYKVFHQLSRQIGLRGPSIPATPRLHDFRHRFAVTTLINWYRSGQRIETVLPILSTYLGHSCVRDTYWYLSACPELLEIATRRLEQSWEVAS